MVFQAGDRVIAESESTARAPRAGTILQVLREKPARYRIEWDDGHESIYTRRCEEAHSPRELKEQPMFVTMRTYRVRSGIN